MNSGLASLLADTTTSTTLEPPAGQWWWWGASNSAGMDSNLTASEGYTGAASARRAARASWRTRCTSTTGWAWQTYCNACSIALA